MTNVNLKTTLPYPINMVWNIVTDLKNATWRSDLDHIEIIDSHTFIEYTKDHFATTFTITTIEPMKRYEFDMDNENMHGHWIGLFHGNETETALDFTECVDVKKMMMKPFVKGYLKKQQQTYISDLEKALR